MTDWMIPSALLTLLALTFLLLPILRREPEQNTNAPVDRSKVNVQLYRDRLAELEAERQRGSYTDDEFERLKVELQQQLLDEVDAGNGKAARRQLPLWPMAVVLLVVLPLFAFTLYQQIGAREDLQLRDTLVAVQQAFNEGKEPVETLRRLQTQLEQRLRQQPDNGQYLMLAAQTAMQLSDYPSAVNAYATLYAMNPSDPTITGQYAQALYLASGGQLTDRVMKLANDALALNPNQSTVLGLLGIHYFEHAEYARAVEYWQRLMAMLDPASANGKMISQGIAEAKRRAAEAGQAAAAEPKSAVASPVLLVDVALDDKLKAPADASVFVYARAVNGPRMPLAVQRLTIDQLPGRVRLDKSMAMAPNFSLDTVDRVEIVARISSSGVANASSGDIEGSTGPIELVDGEQSVSVLLDRILP